MVVPVDRASFKEYCLDNKYSRWYFSIIEKAKSSDRKKLKSNNKNYKNLRFIGQKKVFFYKIFLHTYCVCGNFLRIL